MSKLWKPPVYSPKALGVQWLNNIHQTHDLYCGCPSPLKHLQELIKEKECRHFVDAATTTETGGDTTENVDTFDEGDLQQLFEAEKEENIR